MHVYETWLVLAIAINGKAILLLFVVFDALESVSQVSRIVFELFSDICPRTCENFRSLTTGAAFLSKIAFSCNVGGGRREGRRSNDAETAPLRSDAISSRHQEFYDTVGRF